MNGSTEGLPYRSYFVLMRLMSYRVADNELALTLEVALSGAPSFMVADLDHRDRHRRNVAVTALASHLAARMRCYEIMGEAPRPVDHPCLFEEL